jgi:hypothetical protein
LEQKPDVQLRLSDVQWPRPALFDDLIQDKGVASG